jgi:tRNA threonylcarbamoyl adenosine modification protein (Sua5/YciO/YrdC/YwlC family)
VSTFDCSDPDQREAGLKAAEGAARAGNLVVMPTDTVYGIGADAFNSPAVSALLAAKGRGRDMPVPVLVGSWSTLDGLARNVDDAARSLIEAFWPGGLSLVIQQAPSLAWDLGDTNGTVMVRMPMHPVALDLLRTVGPRAVSRATRSGRPPASPAAAAIAQLGMDVSVYLDGGEAPVGVPSTIVDLTGAAPRVLREGAVSLDKIRKVIDIPVAG